MNNNDKVKFTKLIKREVVGGDNGIGRLSGKLEYDNLLKLS